MDRHDGEWWGVMPDDKWITVDGYKVLNENYDYCEKCEWMFYGTKCPDCGSKNARIGKVKDDKDKS